MKATPEHNDRIAKMKFGSVYPHYLNKVEKKGRSIDELHELMEWLTGYDTDRILELKDSDITFLEFFQDANLHPNASMITGVICGYRIEDLENPLTQQVRYLDKLVDELARGRKMEKILRVAK